VVLYCLLLIAYFTFFFFFVCMFLCLFVCFYSYFSYFNTKKQNKQKTILFGALLSAIYKPRKLLYECNIIVPVSLFSDPPPNFLLFHPLFLY